MCDWVGETRMHHVIQAELSLVKIVKEFKAS